MLSDDTSDCGRIPRTLDCELLDDLVDSVAPGENVTVSGTLHVLDSDESKRDLQAIKIFILFGLF